MMLNIQLPEKELYNHDVYGAEFQPYHDGKMHAYFKQIVRTGITNGGQTTFTESSANAATVTINRSTSGRKAVAAARKLSAKSGRPLAPVRAAPAGRL